VQYHRGLPAGIARHQGLIGVCSRTPSKTSWRWSALFRPGPLESGMVKISINRKHGRAKADYFHPELEVSLKPTYGVIVYQEQVMQIAQIIGGYSLGAQTSCGVRWAKKTLKKWPSNADIFVNGAIKRDIKKSLATHLFDLMEKFAGYGFNKSHSAAYALLAYQTAYLKATTIPSPSWQPPCRAIWTIPTRCAPLSRHLATENRVLLPDVEQLRLCVLSQWMRPHCLWSGCDQRHG